MTLGQAGIGPDQAMVFLHIEKTGGTSTHPRDIAFVK